MPELDALAVLQRQTGPFLALVLMIQMHDQLWKRASDLKYLPVGHDPSVSEAYDISSLPAIRLLDKEVPFNIFKGVFERSIPA